jgi:transcriptional regulator with XRE-family HTH domain
VISLGKTIRILRQAKSMKLGELAERAEISAPFLSLIESGERNPSINLLRSIAGALGVPSEALILMSLGSDTQLKTTDPKVAEITKSLNALVRIEDKLKSLLE